MAEEDGHMIVGMKIEFMRLPPFKRGKCIDCDCDVGCTKAGYESIPDSGKSTLKYVFLDCFSDKKLKKDDKIADLTQDQVDEFVEAVIKDIVRGS